jgi:hypothetical protein
MLAVACLIYDAVTGSLRALGATLKPNKLESGGEFPVKAETRKTKTPLRWCHRRMENRSGKVKILSRGGGGLNPILRHRSPPQACFANSRDSSEVSRGRGEKRKHSSEFHRLRSKSHKIFQQIVSRVPFNLNFS